MTGSGYLARLAARSIQPAEGVRPRPTSAFEDRGPVTLGPLSDVGSTSRAIEGGALAESGRGLGRPFEPLTSDSSTAPPEGPAEGKPRSMVAPPAAQPLEAISADLPADDQDASSPHTTTSRPIESASHGVSTPDPANLHRRAEVVPPPRVHLPTRASPRPVDGPDPEHSQVSERLDNEAPDKRIARAAEPTLPLPAPPARSAPAAEAGDGRGAARLSPVEVRRGVDAVHDLPYLAQETAYPPATVSSVLPRVRATASEGEQPTAAPDPPITVTIGRIEVLPPVPKQPAPVSSGHRKAPGAPDLGDYLRGRSER